MVLIDQGLVVKCMNIKNFSKTDSCSLTVDYMMVSNSFTIHMYMQTPCGLQC